MQAVKDELDKDTHNLGIGILHEPTGQIHLAPFDALGRLGHDELVRRRSLPRNDCKGFVIHKNPDGTFTVYNFSGLNGPQGQPGSTQMPRTTFAQIVKALEAAGL